MEELVETVLAKVAEAKAKGLRRFEYFFPSDCCECNIALQGIIRERLPGHGVNHMTVTYLTGRVEKRVIVTW